MRVRMSGGRDLWVCLGGPGMNLACSTHCGHNPPLQRCLDSPLVREREGAVHFLWRLEVNFLGVRIPRWSHSHVWVGGGGMAALALCSWPSRV